VINPIIGGGGAELLSEVGLLPQFSGMPFLFRDGQLPLNAEQFRLLLMLEFMQLLESFGPIRSSYHDIYDRKPAQADSDRKEIPQQAKQPLGPKERTRERPVQASQQPAAQTKTTDSSEQKRASPQRYFVSISVVKEPDQRASRAAAAYDSRSVPSKAPIAEGRTVSDKGGTATDSGMGSSQLQSTPAKPPGYAFPAATQMATSREATPAQASPAHDPPAKAISHKGAPSRASSTGEPVPVRPSLPVSDRATASADRAFSNFKAESPQSTESAGRQQPLSREATQSIPDKGGRPLDGPSRDGAPTAQGDAGQRTPRIQAERQAHHGIHHGIQGDHKPKRALDSSATATGNGGNIDRAQDNKKNTPPAASSGEEGSRGGDQRGDKSKAQSAQPQPESTPAAVDRPRPLQPETPKDPLGLQVPSRMENQSNKPEGFASATAEIQDTSPSLGAQQAAGMSAAQQQQAMQPPPSGAGGQVHFSWWFWGLSGAFLVFASIGLSWLMIH